MEIKVFSGQYEVVNSGIVFVRNGEQVEFLIENLKFYLRFDKNEDTNPIVKCQLNKEENNSFVTIICYNFIDCTLNRMNNFLSLANINNRELTLQFAVSSLNKRKVGDKEVEDMMVMYSWCLKR